MILYNAIRTPDGTVIQSRSVHDYVTHKDANGKYYAVDGGLEYLHRVGFPDYEELFLTDKDKDNFGKVREVVTWGTRGKDGKQPLEYKKIKDLETEHIYAILATQVLSKEMEYILCTELEQRDKKNERLQREIWVKWYLLRWLRGPAYIAQGLIQTLSLGFCEPNWALKADSAFLDARCDK